MDAGILALDADVIFFPVRHHSPACARALREVALRVRPAALLIEGPADFNYRIEDLLLPHRLPIAIYTYVRLADESRRGAYYPFCVYSPEWQAIQVAAELGVPARFIDLPWAEMAGSETASHRYADGELRTSDYIGELCRSVGVDDFDALWDTLFEIEPETAPEVYLERCHRFCFQARELDRSVPDTDLRRETFMAAEIRRAREQFVGPLLVVTGGYHSHALYVAVKGEATASPTPERPNTAIEGSGVGGQGLAGHPNAERPNPERLNAIARGISLTPYSYERLDSLTGYESGMPNPGFYHHVWEDRLTGKGGTYRRLLAEVVEALRGRGQSVSTADLIAVETTARGIASLRGHADVWRVDLVDGIIGSLVKDELEQGVRHPFLEAVHEAFRGYERGMLAEGTTLPPLVLDLRAVLREHDLEPQPREKRLELELSVPRDLERSRLLHRLRGLRIPGFERTGGTDLAVREDMSRVWEQWRVQWSPEFEGRCIEASLYGPSLKKATEARLLERARAVERDASQAAALLLDAALMGLRDLSAELSEELVQVIRSDGGFFTVSAALGHLLYLYRYDEAFGTAGAASVGALLEEAYGRALWLLEGLGGAQGVERALLKGIASLVETVRRCPDLPGVDGAELVRVLNRTAADDAQLPLMRGAASGALWSLGEADAGQVGAAMRFAADPDRLGDFLTGLFALARETVQRHPDLVTGIDEVLKGYSDTEFLAALPAMRLAFSFFTPREKHYMATTLLEAHGLKAAAPLAALEVAPEVAARALALESRVVAAARKYGLRGAGDE